MSVEAIYAPTNRLPESMTAKAGLNRAELGRLYDAKGRIFWYPVFGNQRFLHRWYAGGSTDKSVAYDALERQVKQFAKNKVQPQES